MKIFFKWLLVTYLITVPLIMFGSYISPLSAFVIWLAYIPACGLGLFLLDKIYQAIGSPVSLRASIHVLMAIGLFVYPTWDGFVGKYYLNKMCDFDGGVYVKPGIKIDSLYTEYLRVDGSEDVDAIAGRYQEIFDRYKDRTGLRILEMPIKNSSNKYARFQYNSDDELIVRITSELSSSYEASSSSTLDSYASRFSSVIPYLYLGYADFEYKNRKTSQRVFGFKNYSFIYRYDRYWSPLGSAPHMDCKSANPGNPRFNESLKYRFLLGEY